MSEQSKSCLAPGRFLLPGASCDMTKWSVVACDQYAAQKAYWERVDALVGGAPSALRLILPECYLDEAEKRIPKVEETMRAYLSNGVLSREVNGMVLLRRTTEAGARLGLILTVDLEQYDYAADSRTPIRATEGTIAARIPPRLKIRENAPLELSHVLLLADDPKKTIVEPLYARAADFEKLYDFELMERGGRLEGWAVEKEADIAGVMRAINVFCDGAQGGGIAFAVGDGNHSLATARAHWLKIKSALPEAKWASHPARYATVELTNLHDQALHFEPIHRVIFERGAASIKALLVKSRPILDMERPDIVLVHEKGDLPLRLTHPLHTLPVGTVQMLLDEDKTLDIDYIHGEDAVRELVKERGAVGILLPQIDKASLFPAVRENGPLPRKTFSMGEADEKRFYTEARKIIKD